MINTALHVLAMMNVINVIKDIFGIQLVVNVYLHVCRDNIGMLNLQLVKTVYLIALLVLLRWHAKPVIKAIILLQMVHNVLVCVDQINSGVLSLNLVWTAINIVSNVQDMMHVCNVNKDINWIWPLVIVIQYVIIVNIGLLEAV